jgi:hypothetical protein
LRTDPSPGSLAKGQKGWDHFLGWGRAPRSWASARGRKKTLVSPRNQLDKLGSLVRAQYRPLRKALEMGLSVVRLATLRG